MDNRPIGFFDSGLGGLTCIPYLVKKLPNEKVIYFGDTARTPYGSKAKSTIKHFSLQIADFLVKNDVKMIVIACNTVSATACNLLQDKYPDIPIVGIIEPATEEVLVSSKKNDRIGIVGTKVTIESHTYKKIIKDEKPNLNIFERATPALVPLIEEGIIKNEIMDLTIKHYMDSFISKNKINTLVLGCTHYPLIRENIERLYGGLRIINPSYEIIGRIEKILKERNMLARKNDLENAFYASDLSENFLNMIKRIFYNTDVKVLFKNLDVEYI